MLGEAFGKIGLTDPAIDTLKQALANHSDSSDDLGFQLRYSLMLTLTEKARTDHHLESAVEAEKIASGIAVARFDYRDIQEKYDAAKKLVAELRSGG